MKKFIYLGFLLIIISVNGQMNIVPPSPNASSIAKFVENEVSLNTGTVNVNVPIYKVTVDDVTLDINLAYNTKGVLVAEDASDVGLGWTLNAGGVITRQVRGRPDEIPQFGYLANNYNSSFQNNSNTRSNLQTISKGPIGTNLELDYDPDLYHLTFLNKTAKFILDNTSRKAIIQSNNDLKLDVIYETSSNFVNHFVLTDGVGNKFFFDKSDLFYNSHCIFPVDTDSVDRNYQTSWYLSSIQTASNKFITFSYSLSDIYTYAKKDVVFDYAETYIYRTHERQHFIKSIQFPEGELEVIESNNRDDLTGGKRVEFIRVRNTSGVQIKKIKFNYEYKMGNTDNVHPILSLNDPNSAKRLFLTSVEMKNQNDVYVNKYSFEYDSTLLPSRHSTAIDYWGYYNGFANGDNLAFKQELNRREVNFAKLQAGVLKKIVYPTGGYTEFEYEMNYTKTPYFYKKVIIPEFKNDSNFHNDRNTGIAKGLYFFVPPTSSNVGHYETTFTIQGNNVNDYANTGANVAIMVNANLGNNCTNGIETAECKTTVRLYKEGSPEMKIITHGLEPIGLIPGTYKIKVYNTNFTIADANDFQSNFFSIMLKWREKKLSLPYDFIGGGLRIKSIKNYDSSLVTEKNYSYDNTILNGASSGLLHSIPMYFYKHGRALSNSGVFKAGTLVNKTIPLSGYGGAGIVSYSRVIESITGNLKSKGNNVYTFTNFIDQSEFYKFPYNLPTDFGYLRGLPLTTQTFDSNGVLKTELINKYSFINGNDHPYFCYPDCHGHLECDNLQHILISPNVYNLTNHYYNSKNISFIPIYKFGKYIDYDPITGEYTNITNDYNLYRTSFFVSMVPKKTSTEIRNHLNGDVIIEKKEYLHNASQHHQITNSKITFADSSLHETTYVYAHEKNNQYLIGKNMVAIPLETTVIRKKDSLDTGKVISQSLTKYPGTQSEANTKTAGLPLPYEVWSKDLQNNTTLHKELSYDLYDDKGNIQQYTSKDIPVTIIWGYNDTQPIAKIEGALYDQIKTNAFITAIITASNTDASKGTFNSEQALITALDNLRKSANFSGYQITTYTYDPLVGVRSITPPSGIREVYLYDAANRLKEIREESDTGKLLKEYQYNYKK